MMSATMIIQLSYITKLNGKEKKMKVVFHELVLVSDTVAEQSARL